MVGSIKDKTPNFNFIIPEFNISTWHDFVEQNFRSIDALLNNLFGINQYKGTWANVTTYAVDDVVFIGDDVDNSLYLGSLFKVKIAHTTTDATFTSYYTANPTYYERFADASSAELFANVASQYATKTDGTVIDENGLDTGEYSAKKYKNDCLTLLGDTEAQALLATNASSAAALSESNAANSATIATTKASEAATKAAEASADADNAAESAGLAAAQIPLVTAAAQAQVNLAIAQVALASDEADRAATEASKAIGLEIGSLISSSLPILNAVKYVLADGTQYSRTGVYQAFADYLAQVKLTHPQCFVTQAEFDADVAQYGQCGRYVLDAVNFRVPKITRYIGATVNLADIGKAWSESLPNITGEAGVSFGDDVINQGTGALRYNGTSSITFSTAAGSSHTTNGKYNIDASRSSSTYQNGAKVNPDRITYPYYIVVSNAGQMTPVEIDINNVLTDLALKADKDLNNTIPSQAFKKQSVGWGMPDLTAGIQVTNSNKGQGTYTTEFDCLFQVIFTSPGHCHWRVNDGNAPDQFCGSNGNNYTQTPIYLSKGTKMTGIVSAGSWNVYVYPLKGVN